MWLLLTLGAHAQRGLQYLGLSVCLSVKSHLTYGASVCPENAVTYSAGNEGQKIFGVFSENVPLLRSSRVAIVFHTFRLAIFLHSKVVRMRIIIRYSQLCLQQNRRGTPSLPNDCQQHSALPKMILLERELTAPRVTATTRGVANFRARALA